jgi:cellulose synthase/poly-beta-1,6-N-acetylglucosamine synthase-like glycosyltransferase
VAGAHVSRAPGVALPTTTVIIPALDAGQTLKPCLTALASEGVPGRTTALVVVDDGSRDETSAVAVRAGATVVRGPEKGPAGARNAGLRAAATDVVVFLDADTVPVAGWLREIVSPLRDPDVVAVKGRYRTEQRAPLARFTQLEFEWKYERLAHATRIDYVDTGTAAFRRGALIEAGGFDETLRTSEDVELAYRLASHAGRIVFNPNAIVLHRHTEALAPYFVKKLRGALTRTLVYRRHPGKARGDAYTPPLMGAQIALSGLTAATGAARLFGAPSAMWIGTLAAFLATTLPVVRQALKLDPAIAPLVPVLLYLRAFAQGLGMAAALVQLALGGSKSVDRSAR